MQTTPLAHRPKVLIVKLDATGDVVRTTTLLRLFSDSDVTWLTAPGNLELLRQSGDALRAVQWHERAGVIGGHYDLVINLEDHQEQAAFVGTLSIGRLFGAYVAADGRVGYTSDSREWFDLSLISSHGRERADALKLLNRRSYQELIFGGLGRTFSGERYALPRARSTALAGDVAIAPVAGPVWPMKGWAFYAELKLELEASGLTVNVLPRRASLLEHLGDVVNHRCVVSGDSLPMHLALGTATPCVSLFNCTSPWEIHDYGIQTKLISPLLERFFYKRGFDPIATTAISLESVVAAVMNRLIGRDTNSRANGY